MNETTIENKAGILSELWMNYRDDVEFADFIDYNDLGLPLAYAIANGIVELTPKANDFIAETFDLLLASLGIEDTGFETIDDVLDLDIEE
jgi:hypothetical protein